MASGIYHIRHIASGKVYIGSAINIEKRWKDHLRDLGRNTHHNKRLQNAWNKYGPCEFSFSIIEIVENHHDLINRESWWISSKKSYLDRHGYNLSGRGNSQFGLKRSDESRERMSISASKRNTPPFSDSHREKIRLNMIGNKNGVKKRSIETRIKISLSKLGNKNPMFGKEISESTRIKLIQSHMGHKVTPETREKIRIGRIKYFQRLKSQNSKGL